MQGKRRTPAQSEQLKNTYTRIFCLGMAAFEIVIRHGEDEAVFVFLLAVLGFKPMMHIDGLFNKKPEPQTPAPEAAKEAATP